MGNWTKSSPLRYPGGKYRFAKFIHQAIETSQERPKVFIEPFCGGAGASLVLLENGWVDAIALNDADPLIASFWQVVFGVDASNRSDLNWLLKKLETSPITVQEWKSQKTLQPQSVREAAWKCLFLNRTSFNGILHHAGPIGGWNQQKRTLDVRFNREHLALRLESLYSRREQVQAVKNQPWKEFVSTFTKVRGAFYYFDPPYYHRAEQLYGHLFDPVGHQDLRDYLSRMKAPWILSYDDSSEVRDLYGDLPGINGCVVDQTYSANPIGGNSHVGRELFFSNSTFPLSLLARQSDLHTGLSVVGSVNLIAAPQIGPSRRSILVNVNV
jgi:DNA adenine methylase